MERAVPKVTFGTQTCGAQAVGLHPDNLDHSCNEQLRRLVHFGACSTKNDLWNPNLQRLVQGDTRTPHPFKTYITRVILHCKSLHYQQPWMQLGIVYLQLSCKLQLMEKSTYGATSGEVETIAGARVSTFKCFIHYMCRISLIQLSVVAPVVSDDDVTNRK